MFDAMQIAATGLHAQQIQMDTVANNLANVNTMGFKRGRVGFSDLVGAPAGVTAGAASSEGAAHLTAGVGVTSVRKAFDQGDVAHTGGEMDLLVAGKGFLEVTLPDGARAYFRGGSLQVNEDGLLATRSGHPLRPGIVVPANAEGLVISAQGRVSVRLPGQSAPLDLGMLDLVRFAEPGALESLGDNLYKATDRSGEPDLLHAGDEGVGTLRQGQLETSNVKLVDEMVQLMVAQRAYEASLKIVQAADEMLGQLNRLRS